MIGRWRVALNLGVFAVLFVLMVGWAVRNVVSVDQLERPYEVSASFANAFGVLPNAEVTHLGVTYGAVRSVEREPGGVVVRMEVRRGLRLPEGSTARILRKSAIGEPYVDFEPPPGPLSGRWLAHGAHIPRDRTSVPLEFSELLRSASALISSVPPDAVRSLVHELATGLSGRAESLRALADAGDKISATLAARTEALDRLAANGARVTGVVADHRHSFGESMTALRLVSETLAKVDGDTRRLLETAPSLVRQVADLVGGHKAELDCDLKVIEQLIDQTATSRRLQGLGALLEYGPRAFAGVWDARDVEADGVWVRVGVTSNGNDPPVQYNPPKDLPPVHAVPACASPLTPAGVDYRPRPTDTPQPPPSAGMAWSAAMAVGMATAALWAVGPGLRSAG